MARGAGRAVAVLAVLAVVGVGAWFFRGMIPGPWSRQPVYTEVSEEAAAAADAKLDRLRENGDPAHLSGVEFTSYVRYRMADRFALDVDVPVVSFEGETIRVDGRLPTDRLPTGHLPRAAVRFLPDTADVAVSGKLRTLAPGRAALRVESASFARVPVPREQYLSLLDRVTRDEAGVGEDEVAFQLPSGVGSAQVQGGELVLFPGERR
jgi:hypothetical protein